MMRRTSNKGFTLVEVVVALAIISIALIVLLERRTAVIKEASQIKNQRTLWVLAAKKMAEIELDKTLFAGDGGNGDSGVFEEDEHVSFQYTIEKREEATNDPEKKDEKPKELFFVQLIVKNEIIGEEEGQITLSAYFPKTEEKSETTEKK